MSENGNEENEAPLSIIRRIVCPSFVARLEGRKTPPIFLQTLRTQGGKAKEGLRRPHIMIRCPVPSLPSSPSIFCEGGEWLPALPPLKWTVKWRGGEGGGRPLQQTFWQGKSCSGMERARGGGGGVEAVFRWLFKGDELNMTVVSVMAWGRRRRGRRKVVFSPQTARRQLAAGGGGGGVFREIVYSCRDYCSVMRSWKRQPLCKRRTSYGFFHILLPFFATRGEGEQKKRAGRKARSSQRLPPLIPLK